MAGARNGQMNIFSPWRGPSLLLVLSIATLVSANGLPRGVDPAAALSYDGTSGNFTCRDGSHTLPFERVNDDFCDCIDGSDEPGTSACANGRFHCRNRGHQPKSLSSSFVDDGICDCCDGSDEREDVCANTCLEASAPEFEALRQAVTAYGQALQQRASYVQASQNRKQQWAARFASIGPEIEEKQAELHLALVLKQQAETENQQFLQARQEERQRVAQVAAAQQQTQQQQPESQQQEQAPEQAPTSSPEGETPEERGRRIASQWTSDPAAASAKAQAQAVPTATSPQPVEAIIPLPSRLQRMRAGEQLSELDQFLMFTDLIGAYFSGWGRWLKMLFREGIRKDVLERREKARQRRQVLLERLYGNVGPLKQQPSLATQTSVPDAEMTEALREAIARVGQAEAALHALQKEQHDIIRFSTGDFKWGDDDVFFSFAGRCFEDTSNQHQFTYELCFYDHATQKGSYSNPGSANLGSWRGFFSSSPDPNDTSFMAVLDGGDACSNSVSRSYKVQMVCGEGDKLHDTTETSMCTYQGIFTTPAACRTDTYAKMAEGLAAAEAARAELRAAIIDGKHHDEL